MAPTSTASGFTSPRRAHQPRPDPHNPAPPRREECDSRSASLFSPEPPATPAQTQNFLRVALCVEFAKTAGALAALARHPLVAEPILSGARLLAAPLSGIGVRITRARGAICSGGSHSTAVPLKSPCVLLSCVVCFSLEPLS